MEDAGPAGTASFVQGIRALSAMGCAARAFMKA
jgi:hypothetical protein